jgi:tetratricopeptide (TPR) repeat protein
MSCLPCRVLWPLVFAGCGVFGAGRDDAAAPPAPVVPPPNATSEAAAAPADVPTAVPVGAASTQGEVRAVPAVSAPHQAVPQDAVFPFWESAEFRQRFAESYLAESEYEPRVTAAEREFLVEVTEVLGNPAGGDPATAQDRAITKLQQRVDASSSASVHFMLGSLLFQRERLPEAAASYETAVGKHGAFRRAWKNLALVQMRLANFPAATKALTRTVQLGGADALTYGLLGFALANADDQVGAESAYRLAAMLDPTTLDYRLGLARAYFKQRRYADAAALTGTLITAHPDRGDLWLLQANAFAGLNEFTKAAENLELVDRLGQATTDSLHLLGDIYSNQDLPDLATGAWLRAIGKDQKGDVTRALRAAKALAVRGAHGECQKVLDAIDKTFAAKVDDNARKEMLKLRARIAVASGAGEEEARVLEQIVTLDPLDGEAILLLGQYHQRRGESEMAVLQFERAAGIQGFEADAKVRHAQLLVGKGRYAEALPLLRRAQQVKPRDNVQSFLEQVERVAQGK